MPIPFLAKVHEYSPTSILTSRSSSADAFPQYEVAKQMNHSIHYGISIVPGYSSATVPDFHGLPRTRRRLQKSLIDYSKTEGMSRFEL